MWYREEEKQATSRVNTYVYLHKVTEYPDNFYTTTTTQETEAKFGILLCNKYPTESCKIAKGVYCKWQLRSPTEYFQKNMRF